MSYAIYFKSLIEIGGYFSTFAGVTKSLLYILAGVGFNTFPTESRSPPTTVGATVLNKVLPTLAIYGKKDDTPFNKVPNILFFLNKLLWNKYKNLNILKELIKRRIMRELPNQN